MELKEIIKSLLANPLVQDKLLIERAYEHPGPSTFVNPQNLLLKDANIRDFEIKNGDDCASIPNGDGTYTLFAAEGIIQNFVRNSPWFAGYSSIMVNISDICSMGGLPIAVTNVLWSKDKEASEEIWKGMVRASSDYGVPIVGGHTCYGNDTNLAVSIIGKAKSLLTSFDAETGDKLLMAIDLEGAYFENYPFWNASTTSKPEKLKRNLRFLYEIAEENLSRAAKDISMGGIVGTLGMFMRTSQKGALLDLDKLPIPENADLLKWLTCFPSYGYLLTAKQDDTAKIIEKFKSGGITCNVIGDINNSQKITLKKGDKLEILN